MPSNKLIQEAANKLFCQRVAFLAMRAAHEAAKEAPDDLARMAYAEFVFRGEERAVLLAMHVVAASDAVRVALEEGGADAVQDTDIENALRDIWALRSAAFGATNMQVRKMQELVAQVTKAVDEAQSAAVEVRQARAKPPK
jgi:hypothetical protein